MRHCIDSCFFDESAAVKLFLRYYRFVYVVERF